MGNLVQNTMPSGFIGLPATAPTGAQPQCQPGGTANPNKMFTHPQEIYISLHWILLNAPGETCRIMRFCSNTARAAKTCCGAKPDDAATEANDLSALPK